MKTPLTFIFLFFFSQIFAQPFGINLAGAEFGTNRPGFGGDMPGQFNIDYTYPNAQELDYYQSKGFELVRIPVRWERLQNNLNGPINSAEVNRLKNLLNEVQNRNMKAIIDVHNYGRYKISGIEYIIGSSTVSVAHVKDFWTKLAFELKGRNEIWGYGIMNEPHDMLPQVSWFSIAQEIINGIRSTDQATTIIVGGDSWSSALRWVNESDNLKNLSDPNNNLIYEAHVYFDNDQSGTYNDDYVTEGGTPDKGIEYVADFVNWLQQNNLKGFIGEYGIPANDARWLTTLDRFLAYLEANCINGTYWAGGRWWPDDYELSIEPINGNERPQMAIVEKYTSLLSTCGGNNTFACEGFESGLGLFSQSSNDNIDWIRKSGRTSSSATGPSAALEGNYYMYVESSYPNYPNKVAKLISQNFTITDPNVSTLIIPYHMYGSTMGSLSVNIIQGNQSTNVFTVSGDQLNSWKEASINLSSYLNQSIAVEIVGTTGTSYRSDIAIDYICLGSGPACTPGALCNDGDECTVNDVYQSNCSCSGETFSPTISNITFQNNPTGCREVNQMIINYPTTLAFLEFDISIDGGNTYKEAYTPQGSITFDAGPGNYSIYMRTEDGGCPKKITDLLVDAPADSDGDGICDLEDSCPNDPNNNCGSGNCDIGNTTNFDNGNWGFWQDGGANAVFLTSPTYSNSPPNSIYLKGNTLSSNIRTFEFSHNGSIQIDFNLFPLSMETGDKFHIEVVNENTFWTIAKTYVSGQDFMNGVRKDLSLTITDFDFSRDARIRFRAETNSLSDYIILDDIVLSFCGDACTDVDQDGVCQESDPNDNDPCIPNSCAQVDCSRDANIDQTCSYNESFEPNFGLWLNDSGSQINWARRSGGTPSSSTGPSSANNGSVYIYVESSTSGRGYPNKVAILESPCFTIPNASSNGMFFSFDYHMYGSTMGSLVLEITSDDINWNSVWSKSGNQGNQWESASINITQFNGQSVRLRFRAVTGSSYRSDIAIDNVRAGCNSSLRQVSLKSKPHTTVEKNESSQLQVFPNPVQSNLQIQWTQQKSEHSTYINIINESGQIVFNSMIDAKYLETVIDVNAYPSGLYYVHIKQGELEQVKKFIKFK